MQKNQSIYLLLEALNPVILYPGVLKTLSVAWSWSKMLKLDFWRELAKETLWKEHKLPLITNKPFND